KSQPGNMTPGTDGMTLDGWSLTTIRAIIQEMQTEQFQFKPVRTVYIPKANGKMRKLGIPSTRDKVVQEAIHMILEAIYDSPYGRSFWDIRPGLGQNRICNIARRCCICGSWERVKMHHVRHMRKMGQRKVTGFTAVLRALTRKQIPACKSCHKQIHRGAYDGISLSNLAYDPR